MKIKLNTEQVADVRWELKRKKRKSFETAEVSDVFRMLQYWSKSVGEGKAKIKSIAELPDGYLCRVNSGFRESMKEFLKQARSGRLEEQVKKGLRKAQADSHEKAVKEAGRQHESSGKRL